MTKAFEHAFAKDSKHYATGRIVPELPQAHLLMQFAPAPRLAPGHSAHTHAHTCISMHTHTTVQGTVLVLHRALRLAECSPLSLRRDSQCQPLTQTPAAFAAETPDSRSRMSCSRASTNSVRSVASALSARPRSIRFGKDSSSSTASRRRISVPLRSPVFTSQIRIE